MAKLYFRYSTMNAGKSIDLLRCNHNYIENGKKTICFTSSKDDRYGKGKITSRVGISTDATPIDDSDDIFELVKEMKDISCVFVDESQFLSKKQIFQLSDVVDVLNIPVICYGLRSDFRMNPFSGSKYLMAIADTVEEIRTICSVCKDKKAIVNVRVNEDGKVLLDGEQIKIGGNETYKPMCRKCYKKI